MYLNPFKAVEAEPLVFTRILRPPILRRISGGNAAAKPTAIRWAIRRIVSGNSEIYPPDHPATLTSNLRSIAGQPPGSCRAVSRSFPGKNRDASALKPCV